MLEVSPDDLELVDGEVRVSGVPGLKKSLGEIAHALSGVAGFALPAGVTPGLAASIDFLPPAMTYTNGTHVCEVEVDPETGHVRLTRYVVVHDCGRMINPMMVEGQVHGAVAHGIGATLYEWMRYDATGQPLTVTFADYLLPTSDVMPPIEIHHMESPTPLNPLGVKGAAESGTIGAPAAIVSAIEDALRPFGVRITDLPVTPERLLALIQSAKRRKWENRMKAAVLGENGVEVRDLPKPEPKPNEVLIRVRATSLNRADLSVAMGHQHGRVGGVGARLGLECAGEVEAVGSAVKGFKAGDRVMAAAPGGYAEYVAADEHRATRIPANNMTYEQAACFPVALQTMHNAIVTAGRLKAGETLLIQGASSGVGLMGMQIGKLKGASLVMGTSTHAGRRARLNEYGCDLAIDTTDPTWPEQVKKATGDKGVNLIVDMVSGTTVNQKLRGRRAPRPHRQCRPARRAEGRDQFRPARAQAHRLYRRHQPHPHAGRVERGHAADARRPLAGGRGRQAVAADRQDLPARQGRGRARDDEGQPALRKDRADDVADQLHSEAEPGDRRMYHEDNGTASWRHSRFGHGGPTGKVTRATRTTHSSISQRLAQEGSC